MAHHQGFLDAILAAPEDDTPRLVYADWLEDNGDPARAEFIRLQCELAKQDRWSPRHAELSRREQELLREHEGRWKAELPSVKGTYWSDFRRGFVEKAYADSFAAFQREAARIRSLVPLRALALRVGTNFKAFARAECLAGLEELVLYTQGLTTDAFRALAASPHLASLRYLDLDANPDAGPAGVRALAESPFLTRLERLRLFNVRAGVEGTRALAGSSTLARLTELGLNSNGLGDEGAVVLVWSPFLTRLEVLDLGSNQITEAGVRGLASSPNVAGLRELWLHDHVGGNPIGPGGAAAIAFSPHLGRLRDLNLDRCQIGDEGATALAASPNLDGVAFLYLADNGITDVGVAALAASPHLANLETLGLSGNAISDVGAEALATSPHLRPGGCLWLGPHQISDAARRRLEERFRVSS